VFDVPYIESADATTYYKIDDFTDIAKPTQTVLMQHYVWGDHSDLRAWVPTLARHYRVIRMDRRGNGRSGVPPLGTAFTVDGFVADAIDLLDRLGIEKVHFVGQSFGGVVGAALASSHPDRVRSLIMCSTPCYLKPDFLAKFLPEGYPDAPTAVMEMGSWLYFHRGRLGGRQVARPEDELLVMERMERQSTLAPHVVAALLRMLSDPATNITPLLPLIKAPTLLLSPGNSDVTTREEQEMMRDTIPDCEQIVFENAPQELSVTEPDWCSTHTLDFVRKHSHARL
jgi:3-oxoadipate enol-lactonase